MYETTVATNNGWSNRETWLACLWLSNDASGQALLTEARHIGTELYDQADWLEQQLREQLDDEIDEACLWQDLLHTAFERVNWFEIIEQV